MINDNVIEVKNTKSPKEIFKNISKLEWKHGVKI